VGLNLGKNSEHNYENKPEARFEEKKKDGGLKEALMAFWGVGGAPSLKMSIHLSN